MNKMTAGELSLKLAHLAFDLDNSLNTDNMHVLTQAASILRRVASGELAEVVHAHWIRKYDTLSQNYNSDENWYFVCSKCGGVDTNRAKYCHCCSALMDGKDDEDAKVH